MRSRKRIVLIDSNANRRGELAYALWINGYAVQQVSSPEEATPEAELVVGYLPGGDDYNLLARACDCRLVLIGEISRTDLLWRIGALSARRRGPKKGSPAAMRCGSGKHKSQASDAA